MSGRHDPAIISFAEVPDKQNRGGLVLGSRLNYIPKMTYALCGAFQGFWLKKR